MLLAAEGLVELVVDLGDRGAGLAQGGVSVAAGLECVGASVGWVALAFDQPGCLEAVDGLHDRGAGEPELVSDLLLGDRAACPDRGERSVQRGRDPERSEALVDVLAHAVVGRREQEADASREGRTGSSGGCSAASAIALSRLRRAVRSRAESGAVRPASASLGRHRQLGTGALAGGCELEGVGASVGGVAAALDLAA